MGLYLYVEDEIPNQIGAEFEMKAARADHPDDKLLIAGHFSQAIYIVRDCIERRETLNGIVADLRFPGSEGVGGIELYKFIRGHENPAVAETPFRLYSGDQPNEIRALLREYNVDLPASSIFLKPGNFIDIIDSMRPGHVAARPAKNGTAADGLEHNEIA